MSVLSELQWEALVDAIRQDKCIFFLGPDATINYGDPLRQRDFLQGLAKDNPDSIVAFQEADGFLVYDDISSKDQFYPLLRKFYQQPIANPMLEKLAEIPFHVAISVSPDLALNEAFTRKNLSFSHQYYVTKTPRPLKDAPSKTTPLLYNLLGCVLADESLITTHFDLFATVQSMFADQNLPTEIVSMLSSGLTRNVVFLGFEFDKWYYQWVLYLLQLKSSPKGRFAATVEATDPSHKVLFESQYKINFIDQDLNAFVDQLHARFDAAELRKPLAPAQVKRVYNRANIRMFVEKAFGAVEFETFTMIHFPDVYQQFTPGMLQDARINVLMERSERQGRFGDLLEAGHAANAYQYNQCGPYYES